MTNNILGKYRIQAGITLEQARDMLGYSIRHIQRFEAGELIPPPDTIYVMAREYNAPQILRWYRGENDPIGRKMDPPVLNNVNKSLFARFCKYAEELEEAAPAARLAAKILMNKESAIECDDEELHKLALCMEQAVTDIKQVLDEVQECYMNFFGVDYHSKLMIRHRQKMISRGYLKENRKPAPAMVAEERASYGASCRQKNMAFSGAR